MTSQEDRIANKVLQESFPDIVEQLRPNEITALLYSKSRLTTHDLEELSNISKGDRQKNTDLYIKALADKGLSALQDFLDALNETADYQPHEKLWTKLRSKLQEHHQRLISSTSSVSDDQRLPLSPICLDSYDPLQSSLVTVSSSPAHQHSAIYPTDSTYSETDGVVVDGTQIDDCTPMISELRAPSPSPGNTTSPKKCAPASEKSQPTVFVVRNQVYVETDGRNVGDTNDDHSKQHSDVNKISKSATIRCTLKPPGNVAVMTARGLNTSTASSESGFCGDDLDTPVLRKTSIPLPNMVKLKLILLGNTGVGKTSLMHRFLKNNFLQTSATIGSTHETCYVYHTTSNVNIKLSLWDTAGQETPSWITPNCFRDVDVALIVFDMTDQDKKTLHDVSHWRDRLLQYCDTNIPIVLAGNKCDGDPIVNNIKRHAKHVAERLELDSVMETSAKTGFQVETVFERAITLGLSHHAAAAKMQMTGSESASETGQTNQNPRTCCGRNCIIM